MLIQTDPAELTTCGLTGGLHEDYRADITDIEALGNGWRRIVLRLQDDQPKPPGSARKPAICASVVAPEWLNDYSEYRRELWHRIEHGLDLNDVTIYR